MCDLLLTDVVMPGIQGNELAQRAGTVRPELRILLMSGYSQAIIEKVDGFHGKYDLVEKPFTRAQLLHSVASALRVPTGNGEAG